MHHSVKAKANSDRPTILHIAPVNLISQSPATTQSQLLYFLKAVFGAFITQFALPN